MAAEPARYSLFDVDTLKGLRAASDEAGHAARMAPDDTHAAAALRTCEQVAAGVAASEEGRAEDARRILDEALERTTDLRLLFLGFQFHFRSGDYDRAERLTRRRLDLAPSISPDAARAWTNLGLIAYFQGDLDAAETMSRRALDIDTRLGNDFGIARDLGNLAMIPEHRGDLDTAERLYRESLAVAERIGADLIIASKLANLGEIALARGRRDEARALWIRAAALFRSMGVEKHRVQCERWLNELDKPKAE
jgi:tetratricopeptide (TPR) repeat protein